MEKDGLLVLLGYVMTAASWAFLVFAWLFGAHALRKAFDFW